MRIRATVAAVSGALALSALSAPLAQADTSYSPEDLVQSVQAAREAAQAARSDRTGGTRAPSVVDISFSDVKVNDGKPIAVRATAKRTVPVTFDVTHGPEVDLDDPSLFFDVELYRGEYDMDDLLYGDEWPVCTGTSDTTATCKATIDIYPEYGELTNDDATTWKVGAYAMDYNGQDPEGDVDWENVDYTQQEGLGTARIQRFSKLTVNASPEPVKKGVTITVTGKLTRANWETNTYVGIPSGQTVSLQFRKAGSSTYTTVKNVTTTSGGALKTYVKAGVDGYYRFKYAGITSTAGSVAAGDYVDVK
jgi:hypothetical protein